MPAARCVSARLAPSLGQVDDLGAVRVEELRQDNRPTPHCSCPARECDTRHLRADSTNRWEVPLRGWTLDKFLSAVAAQREEIVVYGALDRHSAVVSQSFDAAS